MLDSDSGSTIGFSELILSLELVGARKYRQLLAKTTFIAIFSDFRMRLPGLSKYLILTTLGQLQSKRSMILYR